MTTSKSISRSWLDKKWVQNVKRLTSIERVREKSQQRGNIFRQHLLLKLRDADSGRHTQNRREKVVDLKIELNPGEKRINHKKAVQMEYPHGQELRINDNIQNQIEDN